MSVLLNKDAAYIQGYRKFMNGKLLVLDPGFSTCDCFSIQGRAVVDQQTFNDLGMKEVLLRTSKDIRRNYNVQVLLPKMQEILQNGSVIKLDKKTMSTTEYNIADMLEKNSADVCQEMLARIDHSYNYMLDYDVLIVAGGTGDAWYDQIQQHYKNIKRLVITTGVQNDTLPNTFANVRGYYLSLVMALKGSLGG